MKITKFVHSCLLIEMPEPVNRTVLFDPGSFSEDALNIDKLEHLVSDKSIAASDESSKGLELFIAPHENVRPLFPRQPLLRSEGVTFLPLKTGEPVVIATDAA